MNLSRSTPTLAADPALPQRDLLLDESLMKEYLSRLVARYGQFGIHECERLRTKYRIGASLRVLYKISGSGGSCRIAARAFPRTHRVKCQFTSPVEIHAAELNTMFWIFPHDRKIKDLSLLNDVPPGLKDIEGQRWVKSRIVGHAPEKSVTAQCLSDNNNVIAYAKIYAGDEGRQFFKTYAHLADVRKLKNVQVPRALGYSEQHRLLLLEPVSGVSFSSLAATQREDAFFRLSGALKGLHHTAPSSSLSHSTRFTAESLKRAAATIAQARPDVALRVQKLTAQLIARHNRHGAGQLVFLHGDVHPKNILLDNERLCLLDFDQAAIGAPAVDLGSVIAGLYCDACVGSLTWRDATFLTHAFLAGYGPLNTFAAFETLRWHTAAALLQERALRAVTRIRPGVLQKLPQLLQTAETVLNGGTIEN
jgi:aminoglycoside phosphotransferase